MNRRDVLKAAGILPLAAACSPAVGSQKLPAIFVAHGSPQLLDDSVWVGQLKAWADHLPRPRAILVLSAHWEANPMTLGATTTVPLLHDFSGFPDRYYRVTYPAPGSPELADRVAALVKPTVGEVWDQKQRGLDHGAYVPLVAMYPDASIPVLQASLPSLDPAQLFALGRSLAPLRDEGVLIVGSGFLSHNLFEAEFTAARDVVTQRWAAEFDDWCAGVIGKRDVDALLDYRHRAPGVAMALPTHEHFVPVIAAMGAAADAPVSFPITGWMGGTFTRRSVQLG